MTLNNAFKNGPRSFSYVRSMSRATRFASEYSGGVPSFIEYSWRTKQLILEYGFDTPSSGSFDRSRRLFQSVI